MSYVYIKYVSSHSEKNSCIIVAVHGLGTDHLTCGGYGFLFRSEFFFRTTQELEYIFFCRTKREFFFQNLTLGFMTKTLNQIFFSSTKIRIFFQQHWESEYFFRKKT